MVKNEVKAKEQPFNNQKNCIGIEKMVSIKETKKHKQKDKSLSKSEARCKNLFEYARDVIFTISPEGMITSLNPAFETITGWSRDKWINKSFEPIVHPDDLPLAKDIHQRTFNREIIPNFELRILAKSGEYLTFEFIITPRIHNIGGLGIARNITERKKFEQALQQSEEEYSTLVENIQDGVIVIQDAKIQFASKIFVRMAGYTVEEVIGEDYRKFIAPEDVEMVSDRYERRQAGEDVPSEYELRVLHKDGETRILANANVGLITYRGRVATMVTVRDITDKKRLVAQLLRAQRMESIGTLASGMAHDLNNVLTPMMLSLETLEEKYKEDEQSQRLLTILERNLQRGTNLIKQVMSFAKGIEGERIPIHVAHIISEVEKIAKETFPKNIEIRTEISKSIYTISGDATQLHQVMMNLCVNSRDAMPDGGILTISAENFYVDESYSKMNIEANVGQYIVITVSDTGIGISPEIMDRIFEPFFTTKEHGKGTGLGLSTVLGIVRSHGGFVEVQSRVREGTKFKIYLPAIKTEIQKIEEHKRKIPDGNGELILIADDENLVREITSTTLEAHGYKVLIAEDGAQAIVLYSQNMNEIKVILMDLMMPVMDGYESIRAIRKINPKAKVIAVSGLADKENHEKVSDYTNAFLQKPYTAEGLLRTIHEVISTN